MNKRMWLYGQMGKKREMAGEQVIDGRLAGWMHRWVAGWIKEDGEADG